LLAELRLADLGLLEVVCSQRVCVADYLGLLCLVTANGDFGRPFSFPPSAAHAPAQPQQYIAPKQR
jgi:hypothetical protein